MDLIYDVKYLISSINPEAWYWMVQLDDEFKNYACTKEGIKDYKKIHTQMIIDAYNTKYILFSKLHRENGPAMIWTNGTKQWFINGIKHREDGPAYISNERQSWYIKGKLHRANGPALIWSDGKKEWYFNGKKI